MNLSQLLMLFMHPPFIFRNPWQSPRKIKAVAVCVLMKGVAFRSEEKLVELASVRALRDLRCGWLAVVK